jgi:outer membrane protein W
MPIAFALLLTTQLTAPASRPVTQPDNPPSTVQQAQGQDDPAGTPASTDRPHQIGLGGFGGSGGGVSFRYFLNDRVGVDANVGWSGMGVPGSRTTSGSGGTTFRVAPSAVFMMTKSHALADLDVRPYIGGGINYAQTPSSIQTVSTGLARTSGVGMQVFGGVEFSFASARSIAVSAQVAYYRLAVQPVNLITTSGTDFYVLFHYYMK